MLYLTQYSTKAEISYYNDNTIDVDNFDQDISFDKEKIVPANVLIKTDGSIVINPFKTGEGTPRSITLLDTGIVKFKRSPMGKTIKMELIVPREMASERNIRHHISNAFESLRDEGIDLRSSALKS